MDDKKITWSYLQDVVRCEYLKKKSGPNGALGIRWSQDTKDVAASQKLMAGKRLPQHLRDNIGGPSLSTIQKHLKAVRSTVGLGSPGVAANMDSVREIWEPIIRARKRQPDDDTNPHDDDALPELVDSDDVVMVEMSEDESGIMGRIEY